MNLAWTKVWQVEILNTNNSWYVQNVIQTTTHENEWDQFQTLLEFMIYQTEKITQKKPILSNHQKGHLVILTFLHFSLVILTHDYLTTSQIEQFN